MRLLLLMLLLAAAACRAPDRTPPSSPLFDRLTPDVTGIRFENSLQATDEFDVFRYRGFYNGGGVAIGDINNDGLADVYLTSNMGDNKLFLNKGGWKFEDITDRAGVAGKRFWSTGASMADVNGDGWLDIYVCNSGDIKGDDRQNELFINHGDLTFSDEAITYGLADNGFSVHAAFFDYDRDGDLDCFILNNSSRPVASLGYRNLRNERDPLGGHKLFRNDNGKFVDVSEKSGIYGSVIGFGLGVAVGDINRDQWPDLYVSNDFYERDYIYINNHDGTFSERLPDLLGHLSMFSMGADMADLNNDGFLEIFSTDMLPEDDHRLKTITSFEAYDVYQLRLKNGYYHQFVQNMLQLNNGDGTFSEIAQLAGVGATDWSWGALMADFDNDGRKEIFVSNGIYKDITNLDFVEFLGGSSQVRQAMERKQVSFKEFIDKMPSHKLSNYLFVPDSDFHFTNKAMEWGLSEPSFSNGAAYGDLDNDGDLDLVVNNVNQECFVFRNHANEFGRNNYVAISFKGYGRNTFGLGTSASAFVNGEELYYENMPIRGFQSSMGYNLNIGLGSARKVDSLVVTWPDGKQERLKDVGANQRLMLDHANARHIEVVAPRHEQPVLTLISDSSIQHHENPFNDFDRDRLQYEMLSTQGPALAAGDLNGDGLDDIYIGGAPGHPGSLHLQAADGSFGTGFRLGDAQADETDAVFVDIDNDKDLDLYIVTGGSEFTAGSPQLMDVLFENTGLADGRPVFVRASHKLPRLLQSGSCVRPADVDHDGDMDLFVGTRVLPTRYGMPCDQYLLINDGKGNYTDGTLAMASSFQKLGMVTDAQWFNYDGDPFPDLMVVGEWMGVTIFRNDGAELSKVERVMGLEHTEGWWNRLVAGDLDGDGDVDFVVGNHGLNSKFKPTRASPVSLYVNDFDQNGSVDPLFTFEKGGRDYPFALRQELVRQLVGIKKKFVYYEDYADKTMVDLFGSSLVNSALKLNFVEARTCVLINNGDGSFLLHGLPSEAQFAPVYGIAIHDLNQDGLPDIVLGGNMLEAKPSLGRLDALHGLVLLSSGGSTYKALKSSRSGLKVSGEIRRLMFLRDARGTRLAVARNDLPALFYRLAD